MILGNLAHIKKSFLIFFVSFLFAQNLFAAQNLTLNIKGNERIDNKSIESYLDIAGLKNSKQTAINSSLKKLYESDLFSDVKIYQQNNQIIVEVKENPII